VTKYEFPADIDNFTGAPADQDAACRRMIVAGLEWQDAHPEFPPKFFASGAVGLLSDLHDAVLAASPGCTQDMHRQAIWFINYALKYGWDRLCLDVRRERAKEMKA
jgi:hypothetical protein